ncbi:MAG: DDE-type integrase/transposase/recombinase [Eubacteriales bacterium]
MNSITQDMRFRQSLLKYSEKYGVTKAAIKYKTNRQYIYRWKRRYDGTIESLRDRSRKPHHHPNQHTEQELKLIRDMRRRNPSAGLVVFWVKLREKGYTRTITGLYRVLRRNGEMAVKPKNPKYIPKPYEQMNYPGERVQVDVKFVPAACLVGAAKGSKYYQYTAIDEFSRYRYLEAFEENSTYSSAQFLLHMLEHFKKYGFSVKCVQTDNGFEFTKRFAGSAPDNLTLFEQTLQEHNVAHKLIRPFTPRHNGKVERSHRKDNEYFYATHTFYSFNDFKAQLAVHLRKYNNFPMRPLNWNSPKTTLFNFLPLGVTYH